MKLHQIGRAATLAAVLGLWMWAAPQANAALIVVAPSFSAAAGSSGTFDIVLQNTGSAINVGGFSIGISTTNPAITFTQATINTVSPYIFNGDSLFGPDITIGTGTSLTASDNPSVATFFTVGSGATVGLAHISYSIGSSAFTDFALTLSTLATSLSDAGGDPITINTFTNGTITVTPSSVPEPGSLGLVGLALAAVVVRRKRA